MEALNIILSTQLVIIIFLSSSVSPIPSKKLQGSILPNPPKPSSDRIIFNTVMKGIIKHLASIAGKDGTYTLDESTVRKLKEIFPSKIFVKKLLEELKGGRTMDEFAFVTFLEQNNGFLEKALKICLYGQNGTLFDKYMMIEMFSLSEADAFSAIDHGIMITPKRLAKRLFQYAGITEKDAEQVEIFDKFIKGIMTRLTLIANGGSSAQEPVETLGESTVSKLNRKYPNNAFVQKLLKEVQGGKALDREGFVQFLIQNAGFLAKALKICITYQENGRTVKTNMKNMKEFGEQQLKDTSLRGKDANLINIIRTYILSDTVRITWSEAAKRIYAFGGYEGSEPQATTGITQNQSRTGCC